MPNPVIYNTVDLNRLLSLAPTINSISGNVNLPATYIIGGVIREITYTRSYRTDYLGRSIADPFNMSTLASSLATSHDAIAAMFQADKASITRDQIKTGDGDGGALIFRTAHPLFWSNGFGFIKGFSALRELEDYNSRHPTSDPLDLKQYNVAYDRFLRDLNDPSSTLTYRVAATIAESAVEFYRAKLGAADWDGRSELERSALVTKYYAIGKEVIEDFIDNPNNRDPAGKVQFRLNDGDGSDFYLFGPNPLLLGVVLGQQSPRCFLAGTPVTMADGSRKPIEEIKVGDRVMAFDELADNGMGKLVPQRVTRTMQGTTTEVIDLRGLRVTPGHRFLSDGGAWVAIEKILKDDGVIVEQRAKGPVQVRARTGAAIGSVEDILVPVVFVDKATRRERIAHVRAGIPCLGRKGADGTVEVFNLYRITAHHGGKILPDGRSVDQDGIIGDYLGWPEGVSPLDATTMHDWIVKLDGQPFTPQWIADISDADESRQAINGTPVMRPPSRSSGPTFTHAFSPAVIQVGWTASSSNRKARRKQAALRRVE